MALSLCAQFMPLCTLLHLLSIPRPPSDNEAAGSQRMFHKERERKFSYPLNQPIIGSLYRIVCLTEGSNTAQFNKSINSRCSPLTSLGPGQWAHSSYSPGNRTDLFSTVDCSHNKISTNNFWILTVWNLICCIHGPFKHSLSCKYKLPRAILQTLCLIRQIRDHLKTLLAIQCGIYRQENCRH